MPEPSEVTDLLDALRTGDESALPKLVPIVYSELRRLAARYMRRERPDHTLETAALVHEAYLRLAGRTDKQWKNRAHFFGVAAEAMRGILVDHARARHAAKRGGRAERLQLDEALTLSTAAPDELLALDDALARLARVDPRQSRIVELRYFAGLDVAQVAELLGVSERTVLREWKMAKAWLHGEVRARERPRRGSGARP